MYTLSSMICSDNSSFANVFHVVYTCTHQSLDGGSVFMLSSWRIPSWT